MWKETVLALSKISGRLLCETKVKCEEGQSGWPVCRPRFEPGTYRICCSNCDHSAETLISCCGKEWLVKTLWVFQYDLETKDISWLKSDVCLPPPKGKTLVVVLFVRQGIYQWRISFSKQNIGTFINKDKIFICISGFTILTLDLVTQHNTDTSWRNVRDPAQWPWHSQEKCWTWKKTCRTTSKGHLVASFSISVINVDTGCNYFDQIWGYKLA